VEDPRVLRQLIAELTLSLNQATAKTMNIVEIARNNFNSWSCHNADAIVAAYAEGGVYINPDAPEPLTGGAAIGDFAKVVWTIFPDFSLDLISIGDMGGELIALQWVAHGTNTAAFPDGTPATGRKVTFQGASFDQYEGTKIRRAQAYFDRLGLQKQLGFIKD
jgi:steroid delta-isomerase-like uncharacterized protein